MKVKKLIKQLEKLDPSLEVYCFGYEGGCHEPLEVVDTTTTDGVFLLDSPVPDEDGDEEEEPEDEELDDEDDEDDPDDDPDDDDGSEFRQAIAEGKVQVTSMDAQRITPAPAAPVAGTAAVWSPTIAIGLNGGTHQPLKVDAIRAYIVHGLSANNQYARDCLGEFNALPGVQQIKSKVTFE